MIEFQEVKDELKLNVEELSKEPELWEKIWDLFVRSIIHIQTNNNAKLFESSLNSLGMKVNLLMPEQRAPQQPKEV